MNKLAIVLEHVGSHQCDVCLLKRFMFVFLLCPHTLKNLLMTRAEYMEKVHLCTEYIMPMHLDNTFQDECKSCFELTTVIGFLLSKLFKEFFFYGQPQASWIQCSHVKKKQANQKKISSLYCVPHFMAPTCCLLVFLLLSYIKWYVCMTQVACLEGNLWSAHVFDSQLFST